MRHASLLSILAFGALAFTGLHAQPGEPDPGFGDGGFTTTNAWGATHPRVVRSLSDGGSIVAGFRYVNANTAGIVRLMKITADGSVDASFGNNGVVTWEHVPDQSVITRFIEELPDGQLLVAASVTVAFNDQRPLLLRYLPDGTLDTDFGDQGLLWSPMGEENMTIYHMQVDATGRILLAGALREGAGNYPSSDGYLLRLMPGGGLDASFGDGGMVLFDWPNAYDEVQDVKELEDGRLLICGVSSDLGSESGVGVVVRLLPDGAMDTSFGTNGTALIPGMAGFEPFPFKLAIRPDGRIRLGALFSQLDDFMERVGSIGLLANGELDPSYGTEGVSLVDVAAGTSDTDYPLAILEDEDGALLYVLQSFIADDLVYALARQLANGQADDTFGPAGVKEFELPEDASLTISADLRDDGKLLTLGTRYMGGDFPHTLVGRMQPTATFASIPEVPAFLTGLSLFPNPVADNFTLTFQHEGDGPLRIELMDLQGRLVHRFAERVFVQGEQRLELAWPGGAAQGAYHLVITGRQGRATVHLLR